ncbi:unknown similar to AMEV042 [Choristoneura rosaceana entomopoxvirus 'L']|uniref:Uncharacterized protein n=1 Tax=Choristoneura rosaceana entomopoxvirus 'L' TaxID=1293539 RepID=A0ABM9QK88_9POXV|nr:unknown similar to AMEV042 [Choristoneura rosaceana entomopoxvirus 'L']CCU55962.1 unknown similar to AMEV042 [Choristoneura rosaceana entomopoxvirus 'L']
MLVLILRNIKCKNIFKFSYIHNKADNEWRVFHTLLLDDNNLQNVYSKFIIFVENFLNHHKLNIKNSLMSDDEKIDLINKFILYPAVTYTRHTNTIIFNKEVSSEDINYVIKTFNPMTC